MLRRVVLPVLMAARNLAIAMLATLPLEAAAATFEWQKATARLDAEGERAEVCAREIKRYGDPSELEQAKALYERARTELATARQGLVDALTGKIDIDEETARRLYTLLCVLHIRG